MQLTHMDTIAAVGAILILSGILIYRYRHWVFWLLLLGVFDPRELSDFGHVVFKGAGVFFIVEGIFLVLLGW